MTLKKFVSDLVQCSKEQRISVKNLLNTIISDEGNLLLPQIMVFISDGKDYVQYDVDSDQYSEISLEEIRTLIANNPSAYVYSNAFFKCKNFFPLTNQTYETLKTL